jgi:hypothetical protein
MFNTIRAYGRNLAVASGLALVATMALPQMKASEIDKSVRMSFSGPVEIPGKVLPAGSYVFRTVPGNPNVFMVMNSTETKLMGMAMTIPTYKGDPPPAWGSGGGDARSDAQVHLGERPAGNPQAVTSWNYPGNPAAYEFVYPEGTNETH